jgi:hypothetical protein
MAAYVFLDTNSALHFKRPDEIDWCRLTGNSRVYLVVTPIFVRELEEQKVHNPSRKLRERAARYLQWLAQYVRRPDQEVRPSTNWIFVPSEPTLDFEKHQLSKDVSDDRLIATVLDFGISDSDVLSVATSDVGLQIKLRYHHIAFLDLPEELRLPVEPDPLEKEVQELRRQVAQRREPKLLIAHSNGDSRQEFMLHPPRTTPSVPNLDLVKMEYPLLGSRSKTRSVTSDAFSTEARLFEALANLSALTAQQIEDYNRELEEFYVKYEAYCREYLEWEEHNALVFKVATSASNAGQAPATDIDIELAFPDCVFLETLDDKPAQPNKPLPPKRPTSYLGGTFSGLGSGVDLDSVLRGFNYASSVATDETMQIDKESNTVRFWLRRLKHGMSSNLEAFAFRFPTRDLVQSFNITCTLSVAELSEPSLGELHFIILK